MVLQIAYSHGSLMYRTVALLDFSNTLLIKDRLNVNLLLALKQKKIVDIYLFTDTLLMKQKVIARKQIVTYLEQHGFTVHGVITQHDLVWDKIPFEEIKLLISSSRGVYPIKGKHPRGNKDDKKFYKFLEKNQSLLPELFQAASQYLPDDKQLGSAFLQAENELDNYGDISEITQLKSFCGRVITHYLSQRYNYIHVKELLLDLFFRHCPDWINGVVIADDSEILSAHITDFKPPEGTISPPLTIIQVKKEDEQISYEKILEQHFKKYCTADSTKIENSEIHESSVFSR